MYATHTHVDIHIQAAFSDEMNFMKHTRLFQNTDIHIMKVS